MNEDKGILEPEELIEQPTAERITIRLLGLEGEPDADKVVYEETIEMELYEKICGNAAKRGITVEKYLNMLIRAWLDDREEKLKGSK